ncbi:MAG: hypothetical protein ACRDLQ_11160 [Solirubrobacterales bacterium]
MSDRAVTGTLEFMWDVGGVMLLNLEPDEPGDPHTFEVGGALRERLAGSLTEGDRVEVRFSPVEHEVVDPDSGPAESLRAEVLDVRVLD